VVSRGNHAVRPLDRASDQLDLGSVQVTTVSGAVRSVTDLLPVTHTEALVVLHDGRVAVEWYARPDVALSPLPLHSITKSWVGTLAGQLLVQGRLDAGRLASSYVPELADGGYGSARVRDLLDMRTGGDYVEVPDAPGSELDVMGRIAGWLPDHGAAREVSVRSFAARSPRRAVQSGRFSYRSLDTEVLAWVLEEAARRPLVDQLSSRLLAPLGCEADGLMTLDRAGDPVASGGMWLRARDLARFGQMLLDGGAVGRRQVVSPLFLKDTRVGASDSVTAFRDRVVEVMGSAAPRSDEGMYRNQFWVPRRGGRQLLALGVHGQVLLVDGDNAVVAVKLSRWPVAQSPELFTDGMTVLSSLAGVLGGQPQESSSILLR
jgi:CubicO group peptidase (beta-lactamase class C family)